MTSWAGISGLISFSYMVSDLLYQDLEELIELLILNKFAGSESQLKHGLSDDCQIVCLCALTKIQEVCFRIQNGDVLKGQSAELEKISDNYEQMKRLCAAVTVQGDKKGSKQLSFKAVQSALHQRLQEFRAFDEHCFYLSHLCSHLSGNVQGNKFCKEN